VAFSPVSSLLLASRCCKRCGRLRRFSSRQSRSGFPLLAGPDVGVEIFFGISAFIMIRTSGKAFRPAARLALGFRRLGFCHELGDFGLQLARMLIGKRAVPAALAWIFVPSSATVPISRTSSST
jgi:hypothetical protein